MNKVIISHVILAVLTVFSVVLLAGGLTYSLFYMENGNTTNQKIAIGDLSADLSSVSGKIVLNDRDLFKRCDRYILSRFGECLIHFI